MSPLEPWRSDFNQMNNVIRVTLVEPQFFKIFLGFYHSHDLNHFHTQFLIQKLNRMTQSIFLKLRPYLLIYACLNIYLRKKFINTQLMRKINGKYKQNQNFKRQAIKTITLEASDTCNAKL